MSQLTLLQPERNDDLLWCLTGVVREDRQYYWHGCARVLDMRPIDELTQILANHYSDPASIKNLLTKGDIVYLAPKLKDCEFSGDPVMVNRDPNLMGFTFGDELSDSFLTRNRKSWLSFKMQGDSGCWVSTRTGAIQATKVAA